MVSSAFKHQKITVEEYLQFLETQIDSDMSYELVNGEIVEMAPSSKYNSIIAGNITGEFRIYLKKNPVGLITVADGGFRLNDQTVRIPDVAYISKERFIADEQVLVEGAPNIAIEVISPSETQKMITNKMNEYFQAGVEMVWSVFPESKTVEVWHITNDLPHAVRYSLGDTIPLEAILPDFSLVVNDVFDNIP